MLGLGNVDVDHEWGQDEIETVQQVADTLANLFGRQRAADALVASELRLSAMLANIGDVLLVIDDDGWIRFVNDRVEARARPSSGRRGRQPLPRPRPPRRPRPGRSSTSVETIEGAEAPVTELRVMHIDGSYVWFDADTSGEYDELLGGYVVSLRNMAAQRASIETADRQAELERVVLDLSQWALEVEPDDIIAGLQRSSRAASGEPCDADVCVRRAAGRRHDPQRRRLGRRRRAGRLRLPGRPARSCRRSSSATARSSR